MCRRCVGFNDYLFIRWSGAPFIKYDIIKLNELAGGAVHQAISFLLLSIA